MKEHDIKICIPYYNIIESETMDAVNVLLDSTKLNCALLTTQGTNIANARNILVNESKSDLEYQKIADTFTHYLFLDADVVPTENIIVQLLEYNMDIVSASYLSREQSETFVGGLFKYNENGEVIDILKTRNDTDILMEVDWVGGGCVLVKKEVFENVAYPWFRYPILSTNTQNGKHTKLIFEDVGFCMNVKEHGYKIYMDCSLQVKHLARNYNSPHVTNSELVMRNIQDDVTKMFQMLRSVVEENNLLKEKMLSYKYR